MSETGFAHLLKATTGVSPLQYMKQMRLEHARKSLLSGSNVREVADSVGYTGLSHFTSEFKETITANRPRPMLKGCEICKWLPLEIRALFKRKG